MSEEKSTELKELHIFVNNRKFSREDGVSDTMTGAQIAGLVEIAADNAVVRWDGGPNKGQEIAITASVQIKEGDHFRVTRKIVEGGCGA